MSPHTSFLSWVPGAEKIQRVWGGGGRGTCGGSVSVAHLLTVSRPRGPAGHVGSFSPRRRRRRVWTRITAPVSSRPGPRTGEAEASPWSSPQPSCPRLPRYPLTPGRAPRPRPPTQLGSRLASQPRSCFWKRTLMFLEPLRPDGFPLLAGLRTPGQPLPGSTVTCCLDTEPLVRLKQGSGGWGARNVGWAYIVPETLRSRQHSSSLVRKPWTWVGMISIQQEQNWVVGNV